MRPRRPCYPLEWRRLRPSNRHRATTRAVRTSVHSSHRRAFETRAHCLYTRVTRHRTAGRVAFATRAHCAATKDMRRQIVYEEANVHQERIQRPSPLPPFPNRNGSAQIVNPRTTLVAVSAVNVTRPHRRTTGQILRNRVPDRPSHRASYHPRLYVNRRTLRRLAQGRPSNQRWQPPTTHPGGPHRNTVVKGRRRQWQHPPRSGCLTSHTLRRGRALPAQARIKAPHSAGAIEAPPRRQAPTGTQLPLTCSHRSQTTTPCVRCWNGTLASPTLTSLKRTPTSSKSRVRTIVPPTWLQQPTT